MTNINEKDLAYVTGGCDHSHLKDTGRIKYDITPGKNDWGYHVKRMHVYVCKDCGETIIR